MYTVLVLLAVVAFIVPRTESVDETERPFEAASVITNFPEATLAVVPAESVPDETAAVMDACKSEIWLTVAPPWPVALAVYTNVPPVAASVILVT